MEKLIVTARALPSNATTSTMLAAAAHTSPCVAWPRGAGKGLEGSEEGAEVSSLWRRTRCDGAQAECERHGVWHHGRRQRVRDQRNLSKARASQAVKTSFSLRNSTRARTQSTHNPRPATAADSSGASATGSVPVLRLPMMRQKVALSSVDHAASMHDGVM